MAAADGYNTLLWDLDPQGAASFYYKSQPKTKSATKKLLQHDVALSDLVQATEYDNLDIIPADSSAGKIDLVLDDAKKSKKQLKALLKEVEDDYDLSLSIARPLFPCWPITSSTPAISL